MRSAVNAAGRLLWAPGRPVTLGSGFADGPGHCHRRGRAAWGLRPGRRPREGRQTRGHQVTRPPAPRARHSTKPPPPATRVVTDAPLTTGPQKTPFPWGIRCPPAPPAPLPTRLAWKVPVLPRHLPPARFQLQGPGAPLQPRRPERPGRGSWPAEDRRSRHGPLEGTGERRCQPPTTHDRLSAHRSPGVPIVRWPVTAAEHRDLWCWTADVFLRNLRGPQGAGGAPAHVHRPPQTPATPPRRAAVREGSAGSRPPRGTSACPLLGPGLARPRP